MEWKTAFIKAGKMFWGMAPVLIGVILLIGLANAVIPSSCYLTIFSGNMFLDPLIGASIGSILAGNPIESYVIGGEFLNVGVSLVAVTAFIVAWVSVGLVQLPAEIMILGKKFALIRNGLSFIFSIIVAILTVMIMGLI